MITIIDNYDSFTYNLVQYFKTLGHPVTVLTPRGAALEDVEKLAPDAICLSPGPGAPHEAAFARQVLDHFKTRVPLLGVCLGHQVIIEAFGGKVVKAPQPVHGKTENLSHDGKTIYQGLPQNFSVTRYHSLIADPLTLPGELEVTARSEDGGIMSVRHRHLPVEGMQYHPEAILTEHGHTLLQQFLATYLKKEAVR